VPTNSIQQYVKGLLDGLPLTGQNQPLKAYVAPPQYENLNAPTVFVWGARMRGKRQTAPRVNNAVINGMAGYKELTWDVEAYVMYETVPKNPLTSTIDQEFPLILDSVMTRLWTTTMPIVITDPTTQLTSQVLSIGEEFELDQPPPRAPATLRLQLYLAKLTFVIKEAVQA